MMRACLSLGEFALIERFFARPARRAGAADSLLQGIGDDAALLRAKAGTALAVTTDTLNSGVHFFAAVAPESLGHKALAVNLSDLAAMGAEPLGFTLALTLSDAETVPWLQGFTRGLFALARATRCPLIGGDTTRGAALSITITALGQVPRGRALLRSGAKPGDDFYVSYTARAGIGDARLALEALQGRTNLAAPALRQARRALEWPQPRLQLGRELRGIASAALDLSDGLLGDLGQVLRASGVGAQIDAGALPQSSAMRAQTEPHRLRCQLSGGDDYELLFSAPPRKRAAVLRAAERAQCRVARIGCALERAGQLRVRDAAGREIPNAAQRFRSWDHGA